MSKDQEYITYLTNPEQHTNQASSHAGIGRTRKEAEDNACYWNNQDPFVRTVPSSRAPNWAMDEALEALRSPCFLCDGPNHEGDCSKQRTNEWVKAGCPPQYLDGEKPAAIGEWE